MTGILTLAPDELRPLDAVLVNGSWWTLVDARRRGAWKLKLTAGSDVVTVIRSGDARLTVDRRAA